MGEIFNLANYSYNLLALPYLICGILTLVFGLFVFLANPRSLVNVGYSLMCLNISIWMISCGFFELANTFSVFKFWNTIWMSGGVVFIPVSTYFFSVSWRGSGKQKKFILPFYLLMLPFALLYFINYNLMVKKIWLVGNFWGYPYYYPYFQLSFPFLIFFSFWLILMFLTLYNIFKAYREENLSSFERKQRKFILFIFFLGYLGATEWLPHFGVKIINFGHLLVFLMVTCLAFYGILKYRLFNIELVLKRTFLYSLLIALFTSLYFLIIFFFEKFLQIAFGYRSLWLTALIVAIFALGFRPLQDLITKFTDRYFFKKTYDYQQTIKKASQGITSILKLDELLDLLEKTLLEVVRVKKFSLFVYDKEKRQYLEQLREKRKVPHILEKNNPLVEYLQEKKEILDFQELSGKIIRKEVKDIELEKFLKIKKEMEKLNIVLSLPLFFKGKLIGILNLGEKLSGDPFYQIDFELLITLANQMAITLENIQLYKDLEASKKVLEIKVKARTRELSELAAQREKIIQERTKELQEKIKELEKFQKLAVGRELKMIVLKKEIEKLKKALRKYQTEI